MSKKTALCLLALVGFLLIVGPSILSSFTEYGVSTTTSASLTLIGIVCVVFALVFF